MARRNRGKPDGDEQEDDGALFRRTVSDARPLKGSFVETIRRRPAPRARFRRLDEADALEESLGADADELETEAGQRMQFRRPEVGQRTLRRLARGRYAVQSELDLHGMTVPQAQAVLRDFIDDALAANHRCVRVVHGKGRGSGSAGPVLKPLVLRLLRRWRDVLAFAGARQVDGGSGAVYVLLRERSGGPSSGP